MLAERDGVWHRARIINVLPENFFKVDLFDFAQEAEVELNEIGRAPEDLMKIPVLVRKCALHSFYGRDEGALKSEEKMRSLMAGLETVTGELVEEKEGLSLIKIPCLEEKLREGPMSGLSRRQIIEKLKNNKRI